MSAARRDYAVQFPSVERAAADAVALIAGVLDDAGLNYLSVDGRAKTVASFAEKAMREQNGVPLYPDPMSEIGDTIGVRVITYVRRDVDAVVQLLAAETEVLDDRDLGQETASEGRFGYSSRHLQIRLVPEDRAELPELGDRHVQVQIRTVLQHAWAEFEHDIRYKGTIPTEQRPDFDRRFTLAAGLLELADEEFSTIRDKLQSGAAEAVPSGLAADQISSRELAAYLAGQYAEAAWSRADHYSWIAGLVGELGIQSLAELAETLRTDDSATIDERMAYRTPPGAVRRLDDALLYRFGDEYVALEGNAHRVERLESRLSKLRGAGS
ncbi:GTP pyrophosphokinase [Flexivirga alba]|uniref:GTP pyrophosphokinase family protein n=1 Tax=Flexivirga alba TaxID=702742 RepID=A0ABW2AAU7_9MICO